jgi:hypothetical protein
MKRSIITNTLAASAVIISMIGTTGLGVSAAAQENTHKPKPQNRCVDGRVASNLTVTQWSPTTGTVSIRTVNNAPLCDDVTVFLSDFIVPATYDRNGYANKTAFPQYKYASTSAVLAKNTNGATTLTVPVPDACTNYQIDIYYGPELTFLPAPGTIGTRLIRGKVMSSTATTCTTPATPEEEAPDGKGASETPTVAAPAASTVQPAAPAPVSNTVEMPVGAVHAGMGAASKTTINTEALIGLMLAVTAVIVGVRRRVFKA